MLNRLKEDCIRLARSAGNIHAIISNDVSNRSADELDTNLPNLDLRIVNLDNTVINPKYWVIEYVAFRYSS